MGRYGRMTFPARVSTSCWLAKRTEVVTHPLLPPPCHSLSNISSLLSILLPAMNTDGSMIFTVDQKTPTSCFVGVKYTRLFHFSNFQLHQCNLGCTGKPGLCRDAHRSILVLREKGGMYFLASTPSEWGRTESELLKLN